MNQLLKSKEWLWRRYVKDRMTEQEIADLIGVNQSSVNRALKKHGLKK